MFFSSLPLISDTICDFTNVQGTDKESEFIQDLMKKIQSNINVKDIKKKINCVQHLIFLNTLGYDVSWADFALLGIMANDDPSTKQIFYTAASQIWNPSSEVVIMATNCFLKDLESTSPKIVLCVLSALPSFLTPLIAETTSESVIKLMKSNDSTIRQKAITTFYFICLNSPNSIKTGFQALRSCLDDDNTSVIYSTLTVIYELCLTNPSTFIPLIPKIYKMVDIYSKHKYILIRLVQILTLLASVEARLSKKLIQLFTNLIVSTDDDSLLYQLVYSIIEIPLLNPTLHNAAISSVTSRLNSSDQTIKTLFTGLFLRLLKLNPKLCKQHKELINQSLNSYNYEEQCIAIDLLSTITTTKTLDSIINKLFDIFKQTIQVDLRDQILTKVISICSTNDYTYITDFNWYITILNEFLNINGITCYQIVADQFLDLFIRVPSTRKRISKEMPNIILKNYIYNDSIPLLIAASYILGEEHELNNKIYEIIPKIINCNERVQLSFILSLIKMYIKSNNKPNDFDDKLKMFLQNDSKFIQNEINSMISFVNIIKNNNEFINEFNNNKIEFNEEEIKVPDEVNDVIPLFDMKTEEVNKKNEIIKSKKSKINKNKKKLKSKHIQLIGQNEFYIIETNKFEPNNKQINIGITIKSKTENYKINNLNIEVMKKKGIKRINSNENEKFENVNEIKTNLIIELETPELPQIIHLIFTLNFDNIIESKIKVFPSFFLRPISKIDKNELENCNKNQKIALKAKIKIEKLLNCIKDIMNCLKINKKDENVYEFVAKTTYGVCVVALFNVSDVDDLLNLEVKSSDEKLLDSVMKEMKVNLSSL